MLFSHLTTIKAQDPAATSIAIIMDLANKTINEFTPAQLQDAIAKSKVALDDITRALT